MVKVSKTGNINSGCGHDSVYPTKIRICTLFESLDSNRADMSEALQILTPLLSGFGTWSWMQDLKWTLRRSAGKESATLEQSPLLLRSTDAKAFQALVTATNQGCEYFFSVYKGDFILTLIVSSSLDI